MRTTLLTLLACLTATVPALAQLQSTGGECGVQNGKSCLNSMFGNCCSKEGTCGSTPQHCWNGCQSGYGYCGQRRPQGQITPDGRCGGGIGQTCADSKFGACCSKWGFCGSGPDHCSASAGCQAGFGQCDVGIAPRHQFLPGNPWQPWASVSAHEMKTCTVAVTTTTITELVEPPEMTPHAPTSVIPPPMIPTPVTSSNPPARPTSTTKPGCIPCENQPGKDPTKWCGLDINTNYYKEVPITCRTVDYELRIQNTTLAPDGVERIVLTINGQFPGPTIEANWGDTVRVRVINELTTNGTSLHFHGLRQFYTNHQDGVPSITQCPIAPGAEMTYEWQAESYGTSWYHSHYAIQAWEGVYGPLVIHGPHSAEFDIDAGVIPIQDWSHATVDSMYDAAQNALSGGPRSMENGLINGMNTYGADGTTNQTGQRFEMDFQPGKRYLLRLVNTAIQSTYKFSLDGHTMKVISTDFTPIVPYETKILNINIGQRYNVIVEANQPPNTYWMRADNQNVCAHTVQATDIKGVIRYNGMSGTPRTVGEPYTGECIDEPLSSTIPFVSIPVGGSNINIQKEVTVAPNSANMFKWYLSGETFVSHYSNPTLSQYLTNGSHSFDDSLIINMPTEGEWVYLVVESSIPLPHPLHVHGHDFAIVASGPGRYSASTPLNLKNPPRRDTALLPASGFVVMAFATDNPGIWLAHCHIGWHTSMGMAIQLAEMTDRLDELVGLDREVMDETCGGWNVYADEAKFSMLDSGV